MKNVNFLEKETCEILSISEHKRRKVQLNYLDSIIHNEHACYVKNDDV